MHCDRGRSPGLLDAIALVLAGLAGAAPAGGAQQGAAAARPPLVFDSVTVVDVEHGKLRPAQRVIIMGNRIQAVGDLGAVNTPPGAQVVNARGKYLIPGLWDMHVHPWQSATDVFDPLFIANGVTGFRDAWSKVPLDDQVRQWHEVLAGTRVGPPRRLLAGATFGQHYRTDDSAEVARTVDSLKAHGANFLKLYPFSSDVAAAARRAGIQFGGHVDDGMVTEASDSGMSIIDHMDANGGLDALCIWRNQYLRGSPSGSSPSDSASLERCQSLVKRFRRNGTWWMPAIIAYSYGDSESGARRTRNRLKELGLAYWRDSVLNPYSPEYTGGAPVFDVTPIPDSLRLLPLVQQAGVPILAGTDVSPSWIEPIPPGFALHAELLAYVLEGLTPLNALQSATLNPAKVLHGTDSLGTVAPGKLADLVLLDADPLADILNTTRIRAVVANGRYFDRAALDQLLVEVRVKAKAKRSP